MKPLFLAILMALGTVLLSGCGGGSGNSGSPSTGAPSSPPKPVKLDFCYFGVVPNQIAETYDHTTCVLIMDWGNWDTNQVGIQMQVIQYLQEAKARGIKRAIVAPGFLTWTMKGSLKGTQYLQVFRTQLEALGLLDMVYAWYPLDEPDLAIKEGRMTEENLIQGIKNIHEVFPDQLFMTIYGDAGGYPALGWFDIKGKDKYPHGPQQIPGVTQGMALVPGGADPYRENPDAFYNFAVEHGGVEIIVAFLWSDYNGLDGTRKKGIRNNGLAEAYRAMGLKIKGQNQ